MHDSFFSLMLVPLEIDLKGKPDNVMIDLLFKKLQKSLTVELGLRSISFSLGDALSLF